MHGTSKRRNECRKACESFRLFAWRMNETVWPFFGSKCHQTHPHHPVRWVRGKGVQKLWERPAIWTAKLQICDLALPYGPVVLDVETVWRTNITMYRGMHFAYQKPACMARPKRRNECRKAKNMVQYLHFRILEFPLIINYFSTTHKSNNPSYFFRSPQCGAPNYI